MSEPLDNVPSVSPALAPGIDTENPSVATTTAPVVPETSSTTAPVDTTPTTNGTPVTTQLQNAGVSALNSESTNTSQHISSNRHTHTSSGSSHFELHWKQSDCPGYQERLGPVVQNVSAEATKTTSEFKDLYGSKEIPKEPAATGQPLTQYHSMFYRLLSWQNPRATAITFVGGLLFILAARYMNILHYVFKFTYFILGITAALEVAGKLLFDDGLASKMRPRKYWTISRESLERSMDDIEQLINFFVIETQRIVYAENVYATVGVFLSALVSYWLIKLIPFWGLSFIATCVAYLGPLIYINNREAIDNGLQHAGDVVSSQAAQIKNITVDRTSKATESLKSVTAEYTSKAHGYVGAKKNDLNSNVSSNDFPVAPKQEPVIAATPLEKEPLLSH